MQYVLEGRDFVQWDLDTNGSQWSPGVLNYIVWDTCELFKIIRPYRHLLLRLLFFWLLEMMNALFCDHLCLQKVLLLGRILLALACRKCVTHGDLLSMSVWERRCSQLCFCCVSATRNCDLVAARPDGGATRPSTNKVGEPSFSLVFTFSYSFTLRQVLFSVFALKRVFWCPNLSAWLAECQQDFHSLYLLFEVFSYYYSPLYACCWQQTLRECGWKW